MSILKVTNIKSANGISALSIADGTGVVGADKFTDLAGTGAPDFPNGLTLAGNATGGNITGVTLDDYEEGTWTPTITANGSAGNASSSGSFGTMGGNYTKIGNMVFLEGQINLGTKTAVSSYLYITNVPFIASASYLNFSGNNDKIPSVLSRRNDSGGAISNGRLGSAGVIQLTGLTAGQGGEFSFTTYFRTT